MNDVQKIKVWDLAVRLFHWSLVISFFIAYVSGEEEDLLHIYSGYVVFGLILFRLLWGFIGTRYARFWDFLYGPTATKNYIQSLLRGRPIHYHGHNPVGGWMVMLLLIFIFAVSWSGLELYASEGKGPLANADISMVQTAMANGDEDENENENEGDEFWEEIHEALAEFTLVLVFIHILGVFVASVLHRENLVRAMITGSKHFKN